MHSFFGSLAACDPFLAEFIYQVECQRESGTEKERGCEWEIEGCVLAAIENVSGQTTNGQACASQEENNRSQHQQDQAEEGEDFAKLLHHTTVAAALLRE
jgi:hypothetical protein